jgi:hypothetical protein
MFNVEDPTGQPVVVRGQAVEAEYFFDTDPGVGNGTPLSITSGNTIAETSALPIGALAPGNHWVHVRIKGADGLWSHYESRMFNVEDPTEQPVEDQPELVSGEYFFNTDPGLGNGTSFSFSPADSVNMPLAITEPGLPLGTHWLFLRVQNTDGTWSHYEGREFEVSENAPTCTLPPVEYDYCYGDDVDLQVLYEAYVGESMSVTITGATETNYDYLIIYDGTSTSDPELYNASGDHTGQTFTSTSGSLLLQITSDGSISCEAGSSCCSSGITVAVSCGDLATVTGLADAALNVDAGIKLWPNPSTGLLQLNATAGMVEVFNMEGRLVFSQNLSADGQHTLNLSQLPKGVYHLQHTNANGSTGSKVVLM